MSASASASAALAISASASAQANHASRMACKSLLDSYQPQKATVAEMQQYAGCVDRIYPEEMSPDAAIALKIALAIILLSAPISMFFIQDDWLGKIMWGFVVPLAVGCIMAIFMLVFFAIQFIFS